MQVGSFCRHDVVTVDHGATLQEAARLMREHHVGSLVVTSGPAGGKRVLGLVTDRDLVVEAMAAGIDARLTRVADVAVSRPIAVTETTALTEAIGTMANAGVRRLLVTTAQHKLVGIVSLDDVLAFCAAELHALSQATRQGIARETELRRPLGESESQQPLGISLDPTRHTAHWTQPLT